MPFRPARMSALLPLALVLLLSCTSAPVRPAEPPAEQTSSSASSAPAGVSFAASSCTGAQPDRTPGTQRVRYDAHGLKMDIAFHPVWGNGLEAYEEKDGKILFGPLARDGSCTLARMFMLEFVPYRDAPTVAGDAKAAVQKALGTRELQMGSEPQVTPIGELTAVEWIVPQGGCRRVVLEVVGKGEENYRFSYCGEGSNRVEDLTVLRNLVKGVSVQAR